MCIYFETQRSFLGGLSPPAFEIRGARAPPAHVVLTAMLKGPSNERNRKDLIVKAISDTTETSFSQKNFVWCQPWHIVGGLYYNLSLSFVGSIPSLTRQILNRPLLNICI